jgi:transposase
VTTRSLYGPRSVVYQAEKDAEAKIRRLGAELKRASDQRDILKKSAAYFTNHHE